MSTELRELIMCFIVLPAVVTAMIIGIILFSSTDVDFDNKIIERGGER